MAEPDTERVLVEITHTTTSKAVIAVPYGTDIYDQDTRDAIIELASTVAEQTDTEGGAELYNYGSDQLYEVCPGGANTQVGAIDATYEP